MSTLRSWATGRRAGARGAAGLAGHRVAVFERFGEVYRLPRRFTSTTRSCGCCSRSGSPRCWRTKWFRSDEVRWLGADGELSYGSSRGVRRRPGGIGDYMFFQPELERAIDSQACGPGRCNGRPRMGRRRPGADSDEQVELRPPAEWSEEEPGRLALTGDTRR